MNENSAALCTNIQCVSFLLRIHSDYLESGAGGEGEGGGISKREDFRGGEIFGNTRIHKEKEEHVVK